MRLYLFIYLLLSVTATSSFQSLCGICVHNFALRMRIL